MMRKVIPLQISKKELRAIALSHGFYDLPPWSVHLGAKQPISTRLTRAFDTPLGQGAFGVAVENRRVVLQVLGGKKEVAQSVAQRCLGLEINLNELWLRAASSADFRWLKELKLGRHLLSPTLFEDAFKVLMTTNINWSGTKKIASRAVELFGPNIAGLKAFPRPEHLAHLKEAQLKAQLGCGYRARGILDLCDRALHRKEIYEGSGWQHLSSKEFAEELGEVRGLGKTSVSYLSRFYGKPIDFTVDSWVEKRARELWGVESDIVEFAAKRYRAFGRLAPLVFWFEISRHWHEWDRSDGTPW